jgi:hypothetical protein
MAAGGIITLVAVRRPVSRPCGVGSRVLMLRFLILAARWRVVQASWPRQ